MKTTRGLKAGDRIRIHSAVVIGWVGDRPVLAERGTVVSVLPGNRRVYVRVDGYSGKWDFLAREVERVG